MNKTTQLKRNITYYFFLLISVYGYSQSQTFTSSGTFTVPAGITSIKVEAIGGGGKGGTRTTNGGGAGAGGGAYASSIISVTPFSNYTVNVGSGSNTTASGGDSWFNNSSTLLAKGGNSVSTNGSTGASGGNSASCIGSIVYNGGNGANSSLTFGGGGGSSAGNNSNGNDGTLNIGGVSVSGGGTGGNGRTTSQGNGSNGTLGSGGGGALRTSSGTRSGGNGANGVVIISWTSPQNMNIFGNNTPVLDGSLTTSTTNFTDFGYANLDSGLIRTFKIINSGSGNLILTGTPYVTLSGSSEFSVQTQPMSPIIGSGATIFEINFSPLTLGVKTALVTISNNDPGVNKNPYTFYISATGIQTFPDTDGDGIFDNVDLDDDNDGIPDSIEQNNANASSITNTVEVTLLNETFGISTTRARINVNNPTASTSYCYEDGTTAMASDECDTTIDMNDGQYTVANTAQIASWAPAYWYMGNDHTPSDVNGRMALFNSTNDVTEEFYRTIVPGVTPNAPLNYSFWVINLDRTDAPSIATRNRPDIVVEFRDLNNNLITSLVTGIVPPTNVANPAGDWYHFSSTFTPTTSGLYIIFRNNQPGGLGNDLALDDIVIKQILIDTDQDSVADVIDLDSDNDGIGGIIESGFAALANGKDTMDLSGGTWIDSNNNGWHDTSETFFASNPCLNTDGDAVPNYIDLDSDNDSKFDVDEAGLFNGDGDVNGDGEGDGVDTDKDGILNFFDNFNGFGNSGRPIPQNTLGGTQDYINVASQTVGVYDISKTLFANLDSSPVDGVIDGNTDIDFDGILDNCDTNTLYYGSPRDLNRKLYLDFDGRNDYGQSTSILSGLANASLMAWINLSNSFSSNGIIIGQNNFKIRITNSKKVEVITNGSTLQYNFVLNNAQWYNVAATFDSGKINLFLNGQLVASKIISGNLNLDASLLTIGKNPISDSEYFKGKIDEVRVFNVTLTDAQLQKMVYQEIKNFGGQIRGEIIPKNIPSLPFTSLLRYYRMDTYKDDIIDDLTTPAIDVSSGTKIYNIKKIDFQQAPMPFDTYTSGDFATAVNNTSKEIRGQDIMDYDWSIVRVNHNIIETLNNTDLGMIVNASVTIQMDNDSKIQNDWYLKLDGKIDLIGKSQLVQTIDSDLEPTSIGYIERDQQGQNNIYNYNYWSSPVSSINTTTINHGYTVAGVMKDGTTSTPQNITWTNGLNGSPTSPITLSRYWIFKFQNLTPLYANWQSVGQNGNLLAGQGYTLKGSGSASNQNYTFVGKPNNGLITSTIAANNLNLCGNPYASALDANNFITDNLTSTTGAIYFWEHYSTNSSHVLEQYQGGYATRNLVGGTPPVSPATISGLGSSSKIPNRYIPVGQGFFVFGSNTGGTITFKNSQRNFVKENNAASFTLFKSAAVVSNVEDQDETIDTFKRVRLGFTSYNNYHRQTLLGFMDENATNTIDLGYDAEHLDNQPDDLYYMCQGTKLNIQGVGVYNQNSIYPIGIKTSHNGVIKLMIDGSENFNANQKFFIYDKQTKTSHDITSTPFSIMVQKGVSNNRFFLCFKDTSLPANNNNNNNNIAREIENVEMVISSKEKIVSINYNSTNEKIESVSIFNMIGQNVLTFNNIENNTTNLELDAYQLATGTYIVKVKTNVAENTKKIILD